MSCALLALKSGNILAVPVPEPGRRVLPGMFVPLAAEELLVRVHRNLGRVVATGELLVVMVDAELGVEFEEVEALLLVPRQTALERFPAAVEAHKPRLVRSRPVPVVPVRHVLVELAHRASEPLLQPHTTSY